jgi:branched-chain amino acid transport system substrate-binding protein
VDVLHAGKRPDYDGQSGRISFDSHGDITEANYVVYTYGEDNLPTMTGTESASSSGG